ncbi:GNAT family N-acetyltransferase [Promicromonospora sp. MEB111]|uniref:GNAT family N-acetyltransferase n=1 Tax=Promicromonospora sp. MEB111 TaxID=3040301 RepID=UPI002550FBBD|nr:GNAT family N-acetyltransferase [Promicromonospora sp. MEB111]
MIIRRSTARVRPGLLDEFRTFIEAGTAGFTALDGFVSDEIVVRWGSAAPAGPTPDTLTYVSRWRDAAALAAYAGPGWRTEPVVLPDEDRFLLEPLRVRHVELRHAVPADAPAIAAVWHAAWGDGHRGLVPSALEAVRTRESFGPRAAARVPGTTVAVALAAPADGGAADGGPADGGSADGGPDQDTVAGFVTVKGEELEQLFVAAAHRGSGIASDLLSAGEARIAAAGHTEAWLAVVTGNTRARRFYERAGWSDGGPLDYQAETSEGPVPVATRRYVKRLPR